MVWPEYSKGATTIEEMRDVERRQREYIAYHGTVPWAPENLWGPDEEDDSGSNTNTEEETGADDVEGAGHRYCQESLEDEDLLRIMSVDLDFPKCSAHR
jgi:hypothetical protein